MNQFLLVISLFLLDASLLATDHEENDPTSLHYVPGGPTVFNYIGVQTFEDLPIVQSQMVQAQRQDGSIYFIFPGEKDKTVPHRKKKNEWVSIIDLKAQKRLDGKTDYSFSNHSDIIAVLKKNGYYDSGSKKILKKFGF